MSLFIYTNNVETNIKSIKKYTKKEIMAVVKSNAYGLGANKIIDFFSEIDGLNCEFNENKKIYTYKIF